MFRKQGIPRVKSDIKEGSIAEAGFYKKVGIMTKKVRGVIEATKL